MRKIVLGRCDSFDGGDCFGQDSDVRRRAFPSTVLNRLCRSRNLTVYADLAH